MSFDILVGTYAGRDRESVYRYTVDVENKTFTKVYGVKGLINPSYLLLNADQSMLYAVEEDPVDGYIATLKKEGESYVLVDEQHTDGADPCHLNLDEKEEFLGVVNYSSGPNKGGINMYRLDKDGIPQLTCKVRPEGCGPKQDRQQGPHCHSIYMHGDRVEVCDLGADMLRSYDLDRETGELKDVGRSKALAPGAGPRHIAFDEKDPNWLYVIGELDGLVRCMHLESGRFIEIQSINSLPDDLDPYVRYENRTGAVRMTEDGKYLCVTNRLHDSVALFAIDEKHRMTLLDIESCGAVEPRELTLFGDVMLIGHHESQCITVLKINREEGKIENLGMELKFDVPAIGIIGID